MKWFYLIFLAMLLGAVAYYLVFMRGQVDMDSPRGVAQSFFIAAANNDEAAIEALVAPQAMAKARDLIDVMDQTNMAPIAEYHEDAPGSGYDAALIANLSGSDIRLEFERRDYGWVITRIQYP